MHQERRLRVDRVIQGFGRALPAQRAEWEPQQFICPGEHFRRRGLRLCQGFAHADELRTLAGKDEGGRAGIDRHLNQRGRAHARPRRDQSFLISTTSRPA